MPTFLSKMVFIVLGLFILTACKPGIYYPFGNPNVKPTEVDSHSRLAPKKLGELTITDI